MLGPGHVRTSQHTPGISPAFFNRRRDAVSNQCRSKLTVVKAIEGTGLFLIKPARIGLFVNTFLALLGLVTQSYKKALTLSGLFHAWFLGVILWASLGFAGWSTCALYLVVGSLATKIKMKEKQAKGIAESRGGARGPENVWGSALTAAVCALLAEFSPLDSGPYKLGFVASLATKVSDTVASEVGKAYGRNTYLITTLKQVPPGTEGAVSLEGTLAGAAASVILALYGLWGGLISPAGAALCVVAAFVATTAESYIGATVQGKIPLLTNEVVNFINTAIGAAVAIAGFYLFGLYRD